MKSKGYIFNASFYTTPKYRGEWEVWLEEELFPFVKQLLPTIEREVFEVFSDANQGMQVLSVQFRCSSGEELELIRQKTNPVFESFRHKFGERITNFNSILSKIH
ncbi:DUF4286 family protein [Anaerophaga thermohalophila]|jgi:hypothetical protein|uniref:DUF4286 family protein n=1 Tax=Anaerophaga thermohalophila TaxID=177400 RepID=UPI0003113B06|nr:DUF4286 family protein [Anaerophaga thermohalophila]